MPRVNVRCCCNVNLLLGTVDLPEVLAGERYTFVLVGGSTLTLEAAQARRCIQLTQLQQQHAKFQAIAREAIEQNEIALKSNDTPLERLRLIPSFVEINEERPLENA